MKSKFLFVILIVLFLTSCFKEEINHVPLYNIEISPDEVRPGGVVEVNFNAIDPDGDSLFITLIDNQCAIVSEPGELPLRIIPPYIEGKNRVAFEISDGRITADIHSEINVFSYLYDSFDIPDTHWKTDDCEVIYDNDEVVMSLTEASRDGIYYFDLHEDINPPYSIHMDLALTGNIDNLSYVDKYGIYLNFNNAGADTLVKAMWFRIYPSNSGKNWNINTYADQGDNFKWINLLDNSYGISENINMGKDEMNSIKIVVAEDNTINFYVNSDLVYTGNDWVSSYMQDNTAPMLVLERIGARASGISIKVDNVFVSKKTNLNSSSLF